MTSEGRGRVGSALCGLIMYLSVGLTVYLSLQQVPGFILVSVMRCVAFCGHSSPVFWGPAGLWSNKQFYKLALSMTRSGSNPKALKKISSTEFVNTPAAS